jgi:hypothetical protein
MNSVTVPGNGNNYVFKILQGNKQTYSPCLVIDFNKGNITGVAAEILQTADVQV